MGAELCGVTAARRRASTRTGYMGAELCGVTAARRRGNPTRGWVMNIDTAHSYPVVYDVDPVDYAADNAIVPTPSRVREPSSAYVERKKAREHARAQAEAAQQQAHLLREQSAEADQRDALARAAAAVAAQVEVRRRVRAMASAQAEVERWEALAASMDEPSPSPQLSIQSFRREVFPHTTLSTLRHQREHDPPVPMSPHQAQRAALTGAAWEREIETIPDRQGQQCGKE
ncbi:hypothetical protein B484DRAFT_411999 [Ochromonadaceae sp. CCMP2298]|nr:hypothetical protein B484DRAFT_411999 [Ochromonadaceae sp. CCMP2298]